MCVNKRVLWIDAAKALAIVLIVLGHVCRSGVIHNAVYYLHVPAFFLLSGMTVQDGFSRKRIWTDAGRLLIPYYVFGLISIAMYSVLGKFAASALEESHTASLWENLWELLSGTCRANRPLWFLPSLFTAKLLYYLLTGISKGNRKILIFVAAAGSVVGFCYTGMGLMQLPFSLELTLKLFPFFVAGKLCMPILEQIGSKQTRKTVFVGIVLFVGTLVAAGYLPPVNYTSNTFPAPVLFYIAAGVGCLGLVFVSIGLQNAAWLVHLGQNSLPILLMHKFPVVFFQTVGPFRGLLENPDSLKSFFLGAIPVVALSSVACLLAGAVIKKLCPCLLGRFGESQKRKKETVSAESVSENRT